MYKPELNSFLKFEHKAEHIHFRLNKFSCFEDETRLSLYEFTFCKNKKKCTQIKYQESNRQQAWLIFGKYLIRISDRDGIFWQISRGFSHFKRISGEFHIQ
jgi:hypothetical protein